MVVEKNTEEYSKLSQDQKELIFFNGSSLSGMQDAEAIKSSGNGSEILSTRKGIFHQILVTGAILILASACGMPIGYSAVLLPQLYNSTSDISLDIEMGSWIASIHSLATPLGSFVSGPIADKFGRRRALLFSILPLVTGWSLLAISPNSFYLLAGRIIAGIAVGLIGAPAQVLIAEMADPRLRGILIGAPFVAYSLGILFVYALGSTLHWRTVAWFGNILPILSFIAIFFIHESPSWLIRNELIEKAEKSLIFLRGNRILAKHELKLLVERAQNENTKPKQNDEQMKVFVSTNNGTVPLTEEEATLPYHHNSTNESQSNNSNMKQNNYDDGFFDICFRMSTVKPLVIINIFNLLQIFSGTFLVVFYAIDIISEFGADINTKKAAVMTAIVRLICTIIICFLLLTMKRRTLTIISGLGSGISALSLGIFILLRVNNGKSGSLTGIGNNSKSPADIYFSAACIFVYIAFNTFFMVMPGIMVGELLPAKIRGRIAGYIFAIFNLTLFAITKIFPMVKILLKTHGLFIMFGFASIVSSFLMYLLLPETKGKTLGEIEDYFKYNKWIWFQQNDRKVQSKKHYTKSSNNR